MKSAYELAMERLEKASGPSKKLTDAQKAKIAEIDKIYDAKIAEAKLSQESKLRAATSQEEFDKAQADLTDKIRSLEERREKEKESVWNED